MYTTYQPTYFIDGFYSRRDEKYKNQANPLSTPKDMHRMLKITCYYIELHLNLKRLGFTGEPVT